jgi:hypothetical protein
MTQPEQESTQATKYERASEEPLELRDSYQSHQKEAKHYHQTDGMRGPFTSAVTAERHNLDGVRLGVGRDNFPPVANLEARRNHNSSLGRWAQGSKTGRDPWPVFCGRMPRPLAAPRTLATPAPRFFVSVASKRLSNATSPLDATLGRPRGSVDSKRDTMLLKTKPPTLQWCVWHKDRAQEPNRYTISLRFVRVNISGAFAMG